MRRRGARAIVAGLVLASAVGCGAGAGDAPVSGPARQVATTTAAARPVHGLVAAVGTNRLYQPRRELGLALENVTTGPIEVVGVRLDSERFEAVPVADRRVVLTPGRRLVVPLPYGQARCGVEPTTERFPVAVRLADGTEVSFDAPDEDPGSIARLHRQECAAAAVLRAVDIDLGGRWTRSGDGVSGVLTLSQRRAGATAVVDDVAGNVIFTLRIEEGSRPPLQVSDDAPVDRLRVTVRADRCDGHAVAEFKRPFVLLAWVSVDGADPVPVELETAGAARAALEELLRSC